MRTVAARLACTPLVDEDGVGGTRKQESKGNKRFTRSLSHTDSENTGSKSCKALLLYLLRDNSAIVSVTAGRKCSQRETTQFSTENQVTRTEDAYPLQPKQPARDLQMKSYLRTTAATTTKELVPS